MLPQLPENILRLREKIRACTLCPRQCGLDRTAGQIGACRIGAKAVLASAGPHFGEEPVLVGRGGSGTIFFSGCNLHCVFCQNCDISQATDGQEVPPGQVASLGLALQRQGCVNVNFVTPTHVAHAVAEAVHLARGSGLTVPIVYNCGGYESVEMLRLLEGLVEIYMPDFKYADPVAGKKYSDAPDYPAVATAALAEMYRQVGALRIADSGVAERGVLVRHLVMPHDLARSREVIDIVAAAAPGTGINVMGQYRPAHRAAEFPELLDCPAAAEIRELRDYAASRGLLCVG
ncbi:MAG TPA: radical SAM protein [Phycisphaerae bacterium]|nr:radical SAM protein [Phycisphaerae bacterium]